MPAFLLSWSSFISVACRPWLTLAAPSVSQPSHLSARACVCVLVHITFLTSDTEHRVLPSAVKLSFYLLLPCHLLWSQVTHTGGRDWSLITLDSGPHMDPWGTLRTSTRRLLLVPFCLSQCCGSSKSTDHIPYGRKGQRHHTDEKREIHLP